MRIDQKTNMSYLKTAHMWYDKNQDDIFFDAGCILILMEES